MNAKFFGNSLFGGEFFVKDFPLTDENPEANTLKLSFQGIGNNLVITGRTSEGKTLTVFGVADTTSVTFEVTNSNGSYIVTNKDGSYAIKTENLTWEWQNNYLNINVSTYGFIKAVLYDNYNKEVVYPVKVEQDKIIVVFPNSLNDEEKYTIKLMYTYNGLDVASSLGDAATRNVGISSGNVPIVEENGTLNWKIIRDLSLPYEILKTENEVSIDLTKGNFQTLTIYKKTDLIIPIIGNNKLHNGDKIILQIKNYGHTIYVNGRELESFYGLFNLMFVKVNGILQYWGKQEIKELI